MGYRRFMRRVRTATTEEVLEACRTDETTRELAKKYAPYSVWAFALFDLAQIGGQLPSEEIATLGELAMAWAAFLGTPAGTRALGTHHHWLAELKAHGQFALRPILYWAPGLSPMHILDGRHRCFSGLEFGARVQNFELEVFWSDAGADGLVRPACAPLL